MDKNPITPDNELPVAPDAQELEELRTGLERERDEYKDGWMRAKADLINHKSQEAERVSAAIATGLQALVADVLLVLDSFDVALAAIKDETAAQGLRMIRSQLLDVLKRYGVVQVPAAELVGKEFDPAVAEAIGTQPSSQPEGTVVTVVQEGYRMGDKVLRAARVLVSAPTQS